tara:strand:- start:792 stop:2111 length:1320 start_codon:yes stop_codon:yes gene_type:complete
MAQHDYIIDNATGANVRSDINSVLQAIASNNSGSSDPSTTYAFQFFADTTNNVMKIRNAANNAFIELFQLDGTFTLEDGSASTPALAFRDDLNTGIFSSAADNLDISTGGTTRVNVSSTGINVTGTVIDDGATHDGDVTFTGAAANIVFDKSDNALEFADNAKATFGADADLTISHDGSNSIINDTGTGELQLQRSGNTILSLTGTGIKVSDPSGDAAIEIEGFEGNDAKLVLASDEGDDNGDTWEVFARASDQNLILKNNVSGSQASKWIIDTSGNVQQAGGLRLSGETASANLLDDYEEGSWTPDLRIGGSTTGITYDASDPQSGRYVKIGRQVTVNYSLSLTSKGSQSGNVSIFGLPFAVAADMTGVTTHASGLVGFFNNITNSSVVLNLASSNNSGAALALRHTVGAEDDPDVLGAAELTDTSEFRGSITYFTDA